MNCLAESKRRITKTKLKVSQSQIYFISKKKVEGYGLIKMNNHKNQEMEMLLESAGLEVTGLNKIINKIKKPNFKQLHSQCIVFIIAESILTT